MSADDSTINVLPQEKDKAIPIRHTLKFDHRGNKTLDQSVLHTENAEYYINDDDVIVCTLKNDQPFTETINLVCSVKIPEATGSLMYFSHEVKAD